MVLQVNINIFMIVWIILYRKVESALKLYYLEKTEEKKYKVLHKMLANNEVLVLPKQAFYQCVH